MKIITFLTLLGLLALQVLAKNPKQNKPQIRKDEKLRQLALDSDYGVINIENSKDLIDILYVSPVNYSIFMFLSAPNCGFCNQVEEEFIKVASYYEQQGYLYPQTVQERDQEPIFFIRVEYSEEFRNLFLEWQLKSVPVVMPLMKKNYSNDNKEVVKKQLEMQWFISPSEGAVTVEKMLGFVNKFTECNVIKIVTLYEKLRVFAIIIGVILLVVLIVIKLQALIQSPKVWLLGSFIIYVICCSGFIYNFLHDVPLMNGGEWYTTQQRQQLGLEGYVMSGAMGFCAILLILWTQAHKVFSDSPLLCRLVYICLFMGTFVLILFIEDIYKKKGWYNPLFYPPKDYVKGSYLKDQGNSI